MLNTFRIIKLKTTKIEIHIDFPNILNRRNIVLPELKSETTHFCKTCFYKILYIKYDIQNQLNANWKATFCQKYACINIL